MKRSLGICLLICSALIGLGMFDWVRFVLLFWLRVKPRPQQPRMNQMSVNQSGALFDFERLLHMRISTNRTMYARTKIVHCVTTPRQQQNR